MTFPSDMVPCHHGGHGHGDMDMVDMDMEDMDMVDMDMVDMDMVLKNDRRYSLQLFT